MGNEVMLSVIDQPVRDWLADLVIVRVNAAMSEIPNQVRAAAKEEMTPVLREIYRKFEQLDNELRDEIRKTREARLAYEHALVALGEREKSLMTSSEFYS